MSPLVIDVARALVGKSLIGVSTAAIVALAGWVLARFLVRCVELRHPLAHRGAGLEEHDSLRD